MKRKRKRNPKDSDTLYFFVGILTMIRLRYIINQSTVFNASEATNFGVSTKKHEKHYKDYMNTFGGM